MKVFICGPKVYRFEDVLFEVGYCGPWPLNKDGDPLSRVRQVKGFYDMYDRFCKLSDEEKEEYRTV